MPKRDLFRGCGRGHSRSSIIPGSRWADRQAPHRATPVLSETEAHVVLDPYQGDPPMPKNPEGLEQVPVEELQDLLDAEKQLIRVLPKIAKSVSDEELETALREHLEVTRGHVQRLERAFQTMEARPRSRPCKGMRGIVEEGRQK